MRPILPLFVLMLLCLAATGSAAAEMVITVPDTVVPEKLQHYIVEDPDRSYTTVMIIELVNNTTTGTAASRHGSGVCDISLALDGPVGQISELIVVALQEDPPLIVPGQSRDAVLDLFPNRPVDIVSVTLSEQTLIQSVLSIFGL